MSGLKKREDLIKEIKSLLLPRKEIMLAYLYGSSVKGTSRPYSDVDIAILLDKNMSVEEGPYGYRAELLAILMKALRINRIDLTILNDAPPFLKFQVIRYGRVILIRSEAKRINFHVETIAKYNDVKRLMDTHYQYLSKRLKNGTYGKG